MHCWLQTTVQAFLGLACSQALNKAGSACPAGKHRNMMLLPRRRGWRRRGRGAGWGGRRWRGRGAARRATCRASCGVARCCPKGLRGYACIRFCNDTESANSCTALNCATRLGGLGGGGEGGGLGGVGGGGEGGRLGGVGGGGEGGGLQAAASCKSLSLRVDLHGVSVGQQHIPRHKAPSAAPTGSTQSRRTVYFAGAWLTLGALGVGVRAVGWVALVVVAKGEGCRQHEQPRQVFVAAGLGWC